MIMKPLPKSHKYNQAVDLVDKTLSEHPSIRLKIQILMDNLSGVERLLPDSQCPQRQLVELLKNWYSWEKKAKLVWFISWVARLEAFNYTFFNGTNYWNPLDTSYIKFCSEGEVQYWQSYEQYPNANIIEQWISS